MNIYQKAQNQILEEFMQIKEAINKIYGYEAIYHIASRIKTPNSIVRKMKKKN